MIERLVIHRFRGIREGVLDDLGKINLLIGPNNSGKTAILEMLYLGGTSGRSAHLILDDVPAEEGESLAFQATTSVRYDFLGLPPLPRLRERHGYDGKWADAPVTLTQERGLAVNLETVERDTPLRAFRLGSPLPEWGTRDKTRFSEDDIGVIALFSLDGPEGVPSALTPPLFGERGVEARTSRWHYLWDPIWVYRWDRQEAVDRLAVWAEEGRSPASERVLLFDFHTANKHFTREFAQWAKNDLPFDWAARIQDHLGRVFPELKGMKVEVDDAPEGQEGESGYIRGDGGRIVIDQFGDGARHAFKVLAGLIALCGTVDEEHPGLFLWEDPELFMHPATLGRLLDAVMSLVVEKPVQLFITTQSLEVLAWLVKYLDSATEALVSQTRAFRLSLADGTLGTRMFVGRGIGSWFKLFGDPRLSGEDEMASPLYYLFADQEEM